MIRPFMYKIAVNIILALIAVSFAQGAVGREEFHVDSDPGVSLFIREVKARDAKPAPPILLIHGARVPGVGSFDLDVPGGSLAGDLAERGFTVYVMDVRGYGRSSRPTAMGEPADKNPPLVRSDEAVRDIGAVVDWIRKRTGERPALFDGLRVVSGRVITPHCILIRSVPSLCSIRSTAAVISTRCLDTERTSKTRNMRAG